MTQFVALSVKNWILYKRSIVGSLLEILFPIIFILFIFMIRQLAEAIPINAQSFIDNPIYDLSLNPALLSASPPLLKYT